MNTASEKIPKFLNFRKWVNPNKYKGIESDSAFLVCCDGTWQNIFLEHFTLSRHRKDKDFSVKTCSSFHLLPYQILPKVKQELALVEAILEDPQAFLEWADSQEEATND